MLTGFDRRVGSCGAGIASAARNQQNFKQYIQKIDMKNVFIKGECKNADHQFEV